MKTVHERFRRETKLPDEAIERLVACGIMDREQLEDVIRGDKDGRRMAMEVTKLSEDELKKALGWTDFPSYCGVTLSALYPLGGVLAPSEEMSAGVSFAPAEHRASIPDHACLTEHYQPVRNQGSVGTCTAFATIATLEGQHNRIDFSEAFNYSLTKSRDGHPDTDGSWLRVSVPVLAEHGSCRESTWSYKQNRRYLRQKPSASAFREARRYKPQSRAISVSPKDISAIRAQIARSAGRPVAADFSKFVQLAPVPLRRQVRDENGNLRLGGRLSRDVCRGVLRQRVFDSQGTTGRAGRRGVFGSQFVGPDLGQKQPARQDGFGRSRLRLDPVRLCRSVLLRGVHGRRQIGVFASCRPRLRRDHREDGRIVVATRA